MPLVDLKELERKVKSCFNFDRSESEHFSRVNEILGLLIGRVSANLALRINQEQEDFVYSTLLVTLGKNIGATKTSDPLYANTIA